MEYRLQRMYNHMVARTASVVPPFYSLLPESISIYDTTVLSTKDEKCFGFSFINWMFPAALNLFFLCKIIEYTIHEPYLWQKANFKLQIVIVKDFHVVIEASSHPVYSKFNTGYLSWFKNRNAENRW